ncbi:MAG: 2-nitropropane dioxygenase [Bdellovibrionaceae bacterium]|nr:2-nitropropane dioxygenase [Pseudobdellovibrionaceae bacterium]|tara:strand:+ start:687 stop:1682 length:996 start_codon:yes stop_codon:yes gene_type:complete
MESQKQAPIKTSFTELFNIDYPIVSAPMFLVSSTSLVKATGDAGGLGTFPALNYRPISEFKKALETLKSHSAPFGVNLIVQKSNKFVEEQLDLCLEYEVPLIITSLGSPKNAIERAQKNGGKTKVFCDVISLTYAQKVTDLGCDGLIAVASGAGGHAGDQSAFALIPTLKEKLHLPVLAAGSIVNGTGMLGAFGLGADGIYMGTRFIASEEAKVDQHYKDAIVQAQATDIVNTDRVDGFPGNFIKNSALDRLGIEEPLLETMAKKIPPVKRSLSMLRAARSLLGSPEGKASYKTVFSAGHGVELINKIESVDEIIQSTVKEYRSLKENLPS